jgi:Rps23 Pro-64 3,4-dihydroxylase Tpa1-like proline 4-hydroxylase
MTLELASRTDTQALATRYAATGSVSVPMFLSLPSAEELKTELTHAELWVEIFRAGAKVYEMPHAQFVALPQAQKDELRRMVEDAARGSLQYRYRAIRVAEEPAERAGRGLALDRFADLLNDPATIALLRTITGSSLVDFADAQATDYRAGDFLTTHDDAIEGKNRLAAYVYSLTTGWQADWGGLLLFERGEEVTGFVPDFNVLRLFAVPSTHHVSYVAPWVDARRLSITGWLRSGAPGQSGA